MYIELLSLLPQEDACLKLIDCFDKLLHKYARLLSYDDAYNDLLLFFIELITKLSNSPGFLEQSNDGRVVNYIAKSVRNHYIYISKSREHTEHLTFSDFDPDHQRLFENLVSVENEPDITELFPQSGLSAWEKEVLLLIYDCGYSASEIARLTRKTRQAVNQAKQRTLRKLKKDLFK